MRLFVGIPLADAVERDLEATVARLRNARSGGLRWTAPDSWHITLEFLGNATEAQFECLRARLAEVRAAAVAVQLGALGCFERSGVLFTEVQVSPELAALQRKVIAATARCGFAAEAREFHPHITIAREQGSRGAREREDRQQGNKGAGKPGARQPESQGAGMRESGLRALVARAGAGKAFPRFTAREFLLYESHLEPGGARYEVRMRIPLGGE